MDLVIAIDALTRGEAFGSISLTLRTLRLRGELIGDYVRAKKETRARRYSGP